MALVQIVSGIIEDKYGRFLLVEGGGGEFKLPTEQVDAEKGEQPVDALRRGIREKTSYVIVNPLLLDHHYDRGYKGDELEFFDFYAIRGSGVYVSMKISRVRWVDIYFLRAMQNQFPQNTTDCHRIDLLFEHKSTKQVSGFSGLNTAYARY